MIKAILLDLDNTLLLNPDKAFARAFLEGVTTHFQGMYGYADGAQTHRASLKGLMTAHNGTQSNDSRMAAHFQQASGLSSDQIREAWDSFYTTLYPQMLEGCVQPVPRAARLIETVREAGFAVVIATNPIYPESAILARMKYAGLPIDNGVYAMVTGSDVMRHPKPDPAYYAEIIARIGVEPDEALMVGDSLVNDMQPAHTLGLHTFHIISDDNSPTESEFNGTLDDFAALIRDPEWLRRFPPLPLQPQMIAPQYRGNIAALFGMLEHVQTDFWEKRPDPNEWSIVQILCHLLEREIKTQRPALERILHENNPFIVAAPPSGPDLPLCDTDGYRIAHQFVDERLKTLNFLSTLQPDEWQRRARHSVFGLTTLLEMAYFTAQHDRLHLNQLCQTIGRCVSFS